MTDEDYLWSFIFTAEHDAQMNGNDGKAALGRLVAAKESAERERDDVLANIYSRDDWIVQQGLWDQFVKEVDGARNTVDALVARVRALEEALGPFARIAEKIAADHPGWDHDDCMISQPIECVNFRRARAALDAAKKEAGE